MERIQQAQEFFDHKQIWMPEYLQQQIGQFNVFPLQNINGNGNKTNCQPYNRKGFYKISLIKGHTRLYYADQNLEFKENALLFSNPFVPYAWEHIGNEHAGFFCVFTETFMDKHMYIKDYPMFKPGNNPLFKLTSVQADMISQIFKNMLDEIESDFAYKYDVLRNRVFDLIYAALKVQPARNSTFSEPNSGARITSIFTELLERQFPIISPDQCMKLRSPADFAEHLAIHINHLNRTLKKVTGQTTSHLIAVRIAQEARILLRHTNWDISEIAWSLGFEDLSHFVHFFKKYETLTPKNFRRADLIK